MIIIISTLINSATNYHYPKFAHVLAEHRGKKAKSLLIFFKHIMFSTTFFSGWLGWAMVLGSFQCQGVLLLLHIVGQGLAVLAAGV